MADPKSKQTSVEDPGATGGPTVKIGDREIPVAEVLEWENQHINDPNWKQRNEHESTVLKQEKREFEELQEERQTEIDSLKEEMETLKTQVANPPGVADFPDLSLLTPQEQANYMDGLAQKKVDSLRVEIQKKEQERVQTETKREKDRLDKEFVDYHKGLAAEFRKKHKEEFDGPENDTKFDEFAKKAAQRFGFRDGKLPPNVFEDFLTLDEDPDKKEQKLKQKIIDEFRGKRSTFTSTPKPATVDTSAKEREGKSLDQILAEDIAEGNLPDLSDMSDTEIKKNW